VPLNASGIVSALLLSYVLATRSFVIPMILGRGMLLFVTNLTYQHFAKVPDYPGGAAIAVILLIASLVPVYLGLKLVPKSPL
jgi:ABC-type spermidine/putrescine transport system permease subunit I